MCSRRQLSRVPRWRLAAWAVLFAASAATVAWGFWPPARETIKLELEPGQMAWPSTEAAGNPSGTARMFAAGATTEKPTVTLDYPVRLRLQDAGLIRLRLLGAQPDALSYAPGAHDGGGGAATSSTPVDPASHNVIVESRLDMPGARVRPYDGIREPLMLDVPVEFVWSVGVFEPKKHRGTAWLFLVIVERSTHQAEKRVALSAQSLEIAGTSFLGLSGPLARIGGGLGLICSWLLAFLIVDDAPRWLRERLRGAI